jgi:cytochrome c-type biogenesis protein CcmH
MSFAFFAAAIVMTIAAVALVMRPLLRERLKSDQRLSEWRLELKSLNEANSAGDLDSTRYATQRAAIGEALLDYIGSEPKHAAPTIYAVLAITIMLPLAAFGGYKWLGGTAELQAHGGTAQGDTAEPAMPVDHGSDMQAAIARLADKLRQNPDDAQGWALLGRTYKATQHYPEARDAFKHALDAAPGDAGFGREYAAAETPDDDRPVEHENAQSRQCDVPALSAGGGVDATPSACPETTPPPNDSTRISVKVSLAPNLKARVLPGDTLFIFAKAAQGPAMPLAIARLTAAQLPASVTLTDAMSMMPNLTLSKFSQIVLGARISKSGNAMAHSGDFQTLSAAVSNSPAEPIRLVIDRTVE